MPPKNSSPKKNAKAVKWYQKERVQAAIIAAIITGITSLIMALITALSNQNGNPEDQTNGENSVRELLIKDSSGSGGDFRPTHPEKKEKEGDIDKPVQPCLETTPAKLCTVRIVADLNTTDITLNGEQLAKAEGMVECGKEFEICVAGTCKKYRIYQDTTIHF